MRLKITGWYKMIGQEVGGDWLVSDVFEGNDYYCFFCRRMNENGHLTNIRLQRKAVLNANDNTWEFHFWAPAGERVQRVTADWFTDMSNAKKAIFWELEKK